MSLRNHSSSAGCGSCYPAKLAAALCFVFLSAQPILTAEEQIWQRPCGEWTITDLKQILEKSPWARQKVIRNVVCTAGANREVEDFFSIRLISAKPIRDAYARLRQFTNGGLSLTPKMPGREVLALEPAPDQIVIGVSFRSDDGQRAISLSQFFRSETTAWMKWNAFVGTDRVRRVELLKYIPLSAQSGEMRFFFPRSVKGEPLVSRNDKELRFSMWVPPNQVLRVSWDVKALEHNGVIEH
jgi:hypothetical protein